MRIATWNVERPTPKQAVKNEPCLEKIREINSAICILTEPHEVTTSRQPITGRLRSRLHESPDLGESLCRHLEPLAYPASYRHLGPDRSGRD